LELRDLIVTPIILFLVYVVAFILRPWVTDDTIRPYYIPALTLKIFGALALGLLYQFYYGGGDTYNFHTHGSRHIWEAFTDDPLLGLKLLFGDKSDEIGIYKYSSHIPFFRDSSSFMIIRIAAILDLFTFSAYSATAVLFAVFGFIGLWALFKSFYELYPWLHKAIAIAVLFIPSVIFWGSGLLKDTVTLACLGLTTFYIKRLFVDHKIRTYYVVLLLFNMYLIFSIKKYILLCYAPSVLLWIFMTNLSAIKSTLIKVLVFPFVIVVIGVFGYFAVVQIGKDDPRYAMNQIANTAMITAYDIAYQTGRDAGSTYSLGELDGTLGSMVRLAPQAINVSLFRPYLWEVRNPLMLMSAFESLAFFMLTIYIAFKKGKTLVASLANPHVMFCLVFSITFAFATGISSYNFGTLSRYKIPLLPFYAMALILIYYSENQNYSNSESTVDELEITE